MKRISSLIFVVFIGIALAIGGGVLLSEYNNFLTPGGVSLDKPEDDNNLDGEGNLQVGGDAASIGSSYTVTLNSNGGVINSFQYWKRKLIGDNGESVSASETYISTSYNDSSCMNSITFTTISGWEILYIPITVRTNTNFTLTFDYSAPSFTPLATKDEYIGLAVMLLSSMSTSTGDCTDKKLNRWQITPNSSGTGTITVNTGSYTTLYLVINGGYLEDEHNYTFSIGNFSISSGNMLGSFTATYGSTAYRYIPSTLAKRYGYNLRGWFSSTTGNFQAYDASGNYVTGGNGNYLSNLNYWTKYYNSSSISTSYNSSTKMSTFTVTGVDGWEIIAIPLSVRANTSYTLRFSYSIGAFSTVDGLSGVPVQIVHSIENGNLNNNSLVTSVISSSTSGTRTVTFNSGAYTTLYLAINGGWFEDGITYSLSIGKFDFTSTYVPSISYYYWNYNGYWACQYSTTLYAQWDSKTFNVTVIKGDIGISSITSPSTSWNYNGGNTVGGGKRITASFGSSYTISVTTRAGYSFAYWRGDSTSTSTSITCSVSNEKDYTYTAYSTPNTYTLTYDANGGTLPVQCPDVVSSAGTVVSILGGRTYTKCYSGNAYVGYIRNCYMSNNGKYWSAPLLVSTSPTAVAYSSNYDEQIYTYTGSLVYNGTTYYYSSTGNWMEGSHDDTSGANRIAIEGVTSISEAALKLLKSVKKTFGSTYGTLATPTMSNYTFAGWWTSQTGGTQITSSSTYTTVGNQTLYAHWAPTEITNTVYLRVISKDGNSVSESNAGGRVDVLGYVISGTSSSASTTNQTAVSQSYAVHSGQQFKITAYTNSGYVFAGFSTSQSPSADIKNPSASVSTAVTYNPTSGTNYYVYFKQLSGNQLKYDFADKYFYFEDGYYPQSRATNESILNSSASATGETINYNDGTSNVELPVYLYGSDKYVKVTKNGTSAWFKFEPIRWRVSDYGVDNFPEWVGNGNNFYTLDKKYKYTDALTMNVWAYMDNWSLYANNGMRIISCAEAGGWNIESASTKRCVEFGIYDAGVGYKSVITSKEWASLSSGWHMFTLTFDGKNARGYLDGNLLATSATFSSGKIGYNSTNTIFVGAEAGTSDTTPAGSYFYGKIQNLIVKGVDTSASEIQNLYRAGRSGFDHLNYNVLSNLSDFSSYNQNFTVVSDLILGVGAMHNVRTTLEGTSVTSMVGYQNIQNTLEGCSINFGYAKSDNIIKVDSYSTYSQNNAVRTTDVAYTSPLRIASLSEIESVGLTNKGARASDMVAFILGVDKNSASYWTRDLSNLGSGIAITASGTQTRPWINQMLGMRFAYTFSEGSHGVGSLIYNRLDYIQSTGTQYIDAGITVNSNMKIEANAAYTSSSGVQMLFGAQNVNDSGRAFMIGRAASGNTNCYAYYNYDYEVVKTMSGNDWLNQHTYTLDCNKVLIDGALIKTWNSETWDTRTNLYIFGVNRTGVLSYQTSAKIYSLKVWENGVLVRDFVPVANSLTGEVGLWDNVNGQFYGNAGTGQFLAG